MDTISQRLVLSTWQTRAVNEYGTGALAAELLHLLSMVGVSPDTLERVHRVAGDEFRHARVCRAVYEAAGGTEPAFAIDVGLLSSRIASDEPPAQRALARVTSNLAIGETLAVVLFQALRREATEAPAVDALEGFIRDDAFHSAVGWDALAEMLEIWGDDARNWLRPRIPGMLATAKDRYSDDDAAIPPAARAWGLMPWAQHREIAVQTLDTDVLSRFSALGLV